jgi:glycine cleavage system H protein
MVALFVAFMFVSLVVVDWAVTNWQEWRVAQRARFANRAAEAMAGGLEALCDVPEGVHLANQHVWLKPDPAGGLKLGADALIARAAGAVSRIILPTMGEQVVAGQPLFRLELGERAVSIPSAITGRIMAVNQGLRENPELLSADPYGSGWVCYINPTSVESAASSVRFGEQATIWLEHEFARLREFIFGQVTPDLALGITSQDGGLPAPGCLAELDEAAWSTFEATFLH